MSRILTTFLFLCMNPFCLEGFDYPVAPRYIPDDVDVKQARKTQISNRLTLERLREWLNKEDSDICSAPFNSPSVDQRVRWLHVPKCGQVFMTTVFRYACPTFAEFGDALALGQRIPSSLVNFTKPSRNNIIKAQDLIAFARHLCPHESHHKFFTNRLNVLNGWSLHMPVKEGKNVVSIFRSPSQRLLSAYKFDMHLWTTEMRPGHGKRVVAWREWLKRTKPSARDFAATPGVGGCFTKMLSGCSCASRPVNSSSISGISFEKMLGQSHDGELDMFQNRRSGEGYKIACAYKDHQLNMELARQAAKKVRRMAFVGLTEFYNTSVCLFHRLFGGSPIPSEFSLYNFNARNDPKNKKKNWHQKVSDPGILELQRSAKGLFLHDESALGDFVDIFDEIFFEAVLARFETDVRNAIEGIKREQR